MRCAVAYAVHAGRCRVVLGGNGYADVGGGGYPKLLEACRNADHNVVGQLGDGKGVGAIGVGKRYRRPVYRCYRVFVACRYAKGYRKRFFIRPLVWRCSRRRIRNGDSLILINRYLRLVCCYLHAEAVCQHVSNGEGVACLGFNGRGRGYLSAAHGVYPHLLYSVAFFHRKANGEVFAPKQVSKLLGRQGRGDGGMPVAFCRNLAVGAGEPKIELGYGYSRSAPVGIVHQLNVAVGSRCEAGGSCSSVTGAERNVFCYGGEATPVVASRKSYISSPEVGVYATTRLGVGKAVERQRIMEVDGKASVSRLV